MSNYEIKTIVELPAGQEGQFTRYTDTLTVGDTSWGLSDRRQAKAAVEFITRQPLDIQREILSAPNTVHLLAHFKRARTVVQLIKLQPLEGQKEILMVPGNADDLAYNGRAKAVAHLIKRQPLEAQKQILAIRYVVDGLVRNGQAKAVDEIKAGWDGPGRPLGTNRQTGKPLSAA